MFSKIKPIAEDRDPRIDDNSFRKQIEVRSGSDQEAHRQSHAFLAFLHSPVNKLPAKIKAWFSVQRNRYIAIGVAVVLTGLFLIVPTLKYSLLNGLGLRASVSVVVLDGTSGMPLKNVTVKIGEAQSITDRDGLAKLKKVRLGRQALTVEKLAYATFNQKITVKAGDNQYGPLELDSVGIQYTFEITNWLSNTPIEKAEVSYGENVAQSNSQGQVLLTIPPVDASEVEVIISADGYLSQTTAFSSTETKPKKISLVAAGYNYFVSKKSGKYDLWRVKLDGSDSEVILTATGKERPDIQLAVIPHSRSIILVNTREGKRNSEGSFLYSLFDIDSTTNEIENIDQSESIRLYGVSKGHLIYVKVAAGASWSNPARHRLISYNPITKTKRELAASNYLNDVAITDEFVYYAPSDYYNIEKDPFLFRVDPQTAAKTTVFAEEVWSIFRTGYDELVFDVRDDWYKVNTAIGSQPLALSGMPADLSTRLYETNSQNKLSLWIDYRDGKGHLIATNIETNEDELTVLIDSGIRYPLRWVDDNHVIFRKSSDTEIADYIIDIRGGEAAKITDVSDIPGFDRWYFYDYYY